MLLPFNENTGIEHVYVSCFDDIANVTNIDGHSLIYEGDEHWVPSVVGETDRYKNFIHDWYRAGLKAQRVFQNQAVQEGYILEVINQDQVSFKQYVDCAAPNGIKRGDFIIRNASCVEVDVKCRAFRTFDGERYFDLKKEDLDKHLNMIKLTRLPVIIAVYQRSGDEVKSKYPYMIDIEDLAKNLHKIEIVERKEVGECLRIPLKMTKAKFKLLEKYKSKR